MSPRERTALRIFLAAFAVAVVVFMAWWVAPSHNQGTLRFVVTTVSLGYAFGMTAYFYFFLARMRRPNPALRVPPDLRVAFATTYVPKAESPSVLERTLRAMLDQKGHPHDVWVLDEGDADDVKDLCRRLGVRHFSRKGIDRYQQPAWPFQTRTKAGNYNAWLDWARCQGIRYDVLLQMDTDHAPQPGYMLEMLRPFADPAVAYVAAPSIVTGNQGESWVVRARSEVEASLHGALQMGYNDRGAPIIFGSHAAFRVAALERIGGFGKTLAEDHHNTLQLNAAGLWGLFSPEAVAIGDGAPSLAEAVVQEYQWSRALTQILLTHYAEARGRLSMRLRFQFVAVETWYPLFGFTHAFGFLSPAIALFIGLPWVAVNFVLFLLLYAAPTVLTTLVAIWVRSHGWLRPRDAPVVSWRASLLTLARWPFIVLGVSEGAIGSFTGRTFPFRVTSKGRSGARRLPLTILAPFAFVVLVSVLAIAVRLARGTYEDVRGYLYLALLCGATYAVFMVVVVILNAAENIDVHGVSRMRALRLHLPAILMAVVSVALIEITGIVEVARVGLP